MPVRRDRDPTGTDHAHASASQSPLCRTVYTVSTRWQTDPVSDLLSPIEAVMWRVGNDTTLRMTVGTLMMLDRKPSREALVERLTRAATQAPVLRRRPDDPTRLRRRPEWIDCDNFNASDHVRTMTVPSHGDLRQVLDLVELIEPLPFDPDRSPWDVTLVDGLEGERAALYLRGHHVVADGLGGISLLRLLLDEQGRAKATTNPRAPRPRAGDAETTRRPGTVTIDLRSAIRPLASGVDAAMKFAPVDAVDDVVHAFQRSLDVANSVSRQVLIAEGPLSPLTSSRSVTSRFEVLSGPGARRASIALGGSRNDLLVAVVACGLGLYHERLGEPCPELRLATPISLRRTGRAGGNWFAPIRVEVPTSADHPGPQFGVIAERLARARGEPALRLTATLASGIGHLPTRLIVPFLQAQADSVDFAVTALPGFAGARHICEATIEESFPFGPRLGCPMNVSAFGNEDRLDMGIALDPAAIVQPDVLLECLQTAFTSFVTDGKPTRGKGSHALPRA